MIPADDAYLAALRHSHESVLRVTAYEDDTLIGTLDVLGVTIVHDAKANIKRTADIRVALDPLLSESRDTLEAISAQRGKVTIEHAIRSGNTLLGYSNDYIMLGTFRVDAMEESTGDAFRTLRCFDRSLLMQEHKFPTDRPLNDTYVNLITAFVQETHSVTETVAVDAGIDTTLTPTAGKSFRRGDDRLRRAQELADALGAWLVNDPDGSYRIAKWPDFGTPSVWDIAGGNDGVLIGANQRFTRQDQFNAVGIEFTPADEATEFKGYIYLWDNDPASPTYYDGSFGKRNVFFTEEYDHLPSTTEAEAVARRYLSEYSGTTRSLDLTAIYNPLLLPGDRIDVTLPDQTLETHVADRITLNLGSSAAMEIETRIDRNLTTGSL